MPGYDKSEEKVNNYPCKRHVRDPIQVNCHRRYNRIRPNRGHGCEQLKFEQQVWPVGREYRYMR